MVQNVPTAHTGISMSSINVGMTPHILFQPTNGQEESDYFYVCKDPSGLPPAINGNIPVFPFGSVVVSLPNTNGQYDANELHLEIHTGSAPGASDGYPVRYSPNFTCYPLNTVGFYRVVKGGGSSVPTGAAIQAYGVANAVNE